MIIDANNPTSRSLRCYAPSGEEIRHVTRADSDTSEITQLKHDENGKLTWEEDEAGNPATITRRMPFRIVDTRTGDTVCEAL